MGEIVLIGVGASVAVAAAARLLSRLLDFDQLAAVSEGDHADEARPRGDATSGVQPS
jgi:hypothetical protein